MLPAFLAPFSDILIKIAAALAIVGAAYTSGCVNGLAKGEAKHQEYVGKQAVASQKLLEARVEVVHQVVTKYVTKDRIIREKGETIIREVPVYVTQEDDSRCDVNAGFVRHYNAAVSNTDPPAADKSDRAPSGVPLSTVAEVSAYNLTLGHRWKERALTCIGLYEEVRRAQ